MSRSAVRLLAVAALASAVWSQGGPPPPPPPFPPVAPAPPGNPVTTAKTNLGKALFWDEQLSSNGAVACGSCHVNARGGSDPRTAVAGPARVHPGFDGSFNTPDDVFGSPGLSRRLADGSYELDATFRVHRQVTSRKAPSAINAGFGPRLFWDGRAEGPFLDPLTNAVVIPLGAALEIQALGPPVSEVEMAHVGRDWNDAAARIEQAKPLRNAASVPAALSSWINSRTYPQLFQEAFGTPDVTPVRIAMAIATYERVLTSNQTPFDSFVAGSPGALTPQEQQGLQIFNGIGRCNTCHVGPRFTDDNFHYTGVRPQFEDLGRFDVTGNVNDRGRMRTPGLRNVELRAPYFRNGRMPTIEAVVDFYDRGGDFNAPNKNPNIVPLGLTVQQKAALAVFLKRPLTDPRVAAEQAPFDRPTLFSESGNAATFYGAPTAGTGGFTPQIFAFDPLTIGNPQWTVAVDLGLSGRQAILLRNSLAQVPGLPFQGATLNVVLGSGSKLARAGQLNGTGPGDGWTSVTLGIANDPLLVGQPLFAQWFVLDPDGLGRRWSASAAISTVHF
jgi:cytochrome c peroxidase